MSDEIDLNTLKNSNGLTIDEVKKIQNDAWDAQVAQAVKDAETKLAEKATSFTVPLVVLNTLTVLSSTLDSINSSVLAPPADRIHSAILKPKIDSAIQDIKSSLSDLPLPQ